MIVCTNPYLASAVTDMAKPLIDPSLSNETELFMKMKAEDKVVWSATRIANIVKQQKP